MSRTHNIEGIRTLHNERPVEAQVKFNGSLRSRNLPHDQRREQSGVTLSADVKHASKDRSNTERILDRLFCKFVRGSSMGMLQRDEIVLIGPVAGQVGAFRLALLWATDGAAEFDRRSGSFTSLITVGSMRSVHS